MENGIENTADEPKTRGMVVRKIVSAKPVGKRHMYDLEVRHPAHNFALSNGVITSNSHAAGYSYTAYQCAFLKAHYPHEFMAAQLTIEGWDSKHETVELYEGGLRQMDIELLPACVNSSRQNYTVIDTPNKRKAIRKGLKGIPGLGEQVWADIVAGQPYKNMYDYCYRAKTGTRSDVFTALLDLGAFDCFRPKLAKQLGKDKVTKSDLQAEYSDKVKRAQVDRKEAERNKGMTPAFSVGDDEDATNFVF